ncbi:HAD family hydrolase [Dactylosporangium sp. NPDC000521]|uniref:HAD family hydrolase n=1 Tax=Dactylosporangium sp. NPDC000521 TaxID=3363975 RepID=UPI0036803B02
MLPRFLVFDLFHTLVDGADGERDRVVGEMAEMVGVDPAALRQAYRDTWDERLTRWSVEETIRILAGRLGVSPADDAVARAAAHRRALARRVLDAVAPATLEALDALRVGGARLALVSNATSEAAEAWPACALAARFDVAVFSSVLGVGKPDPRIYLAAAAALGAEPADCVYVGDGADGELAGAAAVGMRVVRTIEHKDTDPTWPGPVISTLRDLADSPA